MSQDLTYWDFEKFASDFGSQKNMSVLLVVSPSAELLALELLEKVQV